MNSDPEHVKIPLPIFLKLLTSNNVPVPKAMAIAGKVYKEYNTRATLSQLNDAKLKSVGLESQEDRKVVMAALRKAGYSPKVRTSSKVQLSPAAEALGSLSPLGPLASSSMQSAVAALTTPTRRKRKKPDDTNEFLPSGPPDEIENIGSLNFGEILDEEILKNKVTVINRAPVMMSWAMIVAECMHFSREEALSIASVYTELNAVTKGVSLGIYDKDKDRGREAAKDGSQPYVDLMGRRPLYRTQAGQWRALSNGSPVSPGSAFSYISRSFRQMTPYIVGAMKLLADSYAPEELNGKGWSMYAEFRPEVNEWGKRSEMRCMKILDLRKKGPVQFKENVEHADKPMVNNESSQVEEPLHKKARGLTWEEYEATLDQDTTFDHVNLDFPTTPEKT